MYLGGVVSRLVQIFAECHFQHARAGGERRGAERGQYCVVYRYGLVGRGGYQIAGRVADRPRLYVELRGGQAVDRIGVRVGEVERYGVGAVRRYHRV